MTSISPWWHPDRHADRRPRLLARMAIQRALRRWFEDQGFVEVEPAALQVSPGNEAHLHAFGTEFLTDGGARRQLYLHTSPEFAMKKLLAAGETKIFTFAQVFRNREAGPLHAPAFTMLEWYRAAAPYDVLKDDCGAILRIAAQAIGTTLWTFRGRQTDPLAPLARLTVDESFRAFAAIDLLGEAFAAGQPDLRAMIRAGRRIGTRVADDDTWSDLFSRILVEHVEPRLGSNAAGPALILDEYPAHEAALARACAHDARVAERFELYACGIELANCFGEQTDEGEQRRRFEAEMAEKQRVYGCRYPIDEDFLAALARMPPASGGALGFDRLVMLATGARTIDDVLWTPVDLAPGS